MKTSMSQIKKLVREAVIQALDEANKAGKTEHSGSKKGKGAYYGKKKDAKKDSKKKRRENDKKTSSSIEESFKKTANVILKEYLDYYTLYQLVDMERESAGIKGVVEVTPELEKLAEKFEEDVYSALKHWIGRNQEKLSDRVLDDIGPVFDVAEILTYSKDGAYLVLMTLRGEGVGIWDGIWDQYFKNPKEAIPELENFLKQKLGKWADDTGGGKLNNALRDAAYESAGNGEVDESIDPHNTKAVLEDAMNEMGWSKDASKFPGVRGLGYDFGRGEASRDKQFFWARKPEHVKMELLDRILDPADVSDEEAMEIAEAFFEKFGPSVETTYGDLKDFVRQYRISERQDESSEPSHMGMSTRKF